VAYFFSWAERDDFWKEYKQNKSQTVVSLLFSIITFAAFVYKGYIFLGLFYITLLFLFLLNYLDFAKKTEEDVLSLKKLERRV